MGVEFWFCLGGLYLVTPRGVLGHAPPPWEIFEIRGSEIIFLAFWEQIW